MPLESLSDEQINIHDLTLEQEKRPESEAEKIFESLKETDLYDNENEQWKEYITPDEKLGFVRSTRDQLIGLLMENIYDLKVGQQKYELFKKTVFFDPEGDMLFWNEEIGNSQEVWSGKKLIENQLLTILIESRYDKLTSLKEFQTLKSRYLKENSSLWQDELGMDDDHVCFTNLLGVLLEAAFDKEEAYKRYLKLKNSQYYDKENQQWHSAQRLASDQLLGVLTEAIFDKDSATKLYNQLKMSPLYDKNNKQWVYSIGEDQKIIDKGVTYASPQLLGILCEREFEEEEPNLQSPTPSLPETRKY